MEFRLQAEGLIVETFRLKAELQTSSCMALLFKYAADYSWEKHIRKIKEKATQAGLEPATPCSGGKCSNPLSYWASDIILANIRCLCQCAGKTEYGKRLPA